MLKPAVGLAFILCCIAAAGVVAWSGHERALIASVAAQARYIPADASPDEISQQLRRPWVAVDVRPVPPPGAPRPQPPPPQKTPLHMLFPVLGITPQRVQTAGYLIVAHPDDAGIVQLFAMSAIALIVFYMAALALLVLTGRTAAQNAAQPLLQTTTELKTLVAEAIREEAEARSQLRRFIADAGHELRTPLTILGAYLDVLTNPSAGSESFAKITTGMRGEVKRMRRLVENLLALNRMEQDGALRETIDAVEVAHEVVDRLSRIAGSREIVLSAPEKAAVYASARDLDDALSNLVENALKYAKDSDVRIAIASNHQSVSINVDDNGPGIPEHDRVRLFDRFFRGTNASGVDGSGLGLAIAKLGVERCGGSLRYESLQPGSRFHIELPVTQ